VRACMLTLSHTNDTLHTHTHALNTHTHACTNTLAAHTHTHTHTHACSNTHAAHAHAHMLKHATPHSTRTNTTVMRVPQTLTQETGENKLVYTDVFHKYTELLEAIIESRLQQAVPGFDMQVSLRVWVWLGGRVDG